MERSKALCKGTPRTSGGRSLGRTAFQVNRAHGERDLDALLAQSLEQALVQLAPHAKLRVKVLHLHDQQKIERKIAKRLESHDGFEVLNKPGHGSHDALGFALQDLLDVLGVAIVAA